MGLVNLGWNLPRSNTTDATLFGQAGYFDTHRINSRDETTGKVIGNDWHRYRDRAPIPDTISLHSYMQESDGVRRDLADFYGAAKCVDESFGRILDSLERNGLADDTVVIFTTDHGIDFPRARTTLCDPGINTTLLMRLPNGIPGGQVADQMISNIDLLPTLLACCGIEVPDDVEGRSFLPFLRGGSDRLNDCIFAEKNNDPLDMKRCIRTDRWKLVHNYSRDVFELTARRRYLPESEQDPVTGSFDRPEWELYQLEDDPSEKHNLSGDHEYSGIETELRNRLADSQVETDDLVLSGMMCRPIDEPGNWIRALRGRPWKPELN